MNSLISASYLSKTEQMAGKNEDKKKKAVSSNDSGTADDFESKQRDYGAAALSLMKLNLGPKKKLLVLDLGGFLCHRVHSSKRSSCTISRRPDAAHGSFVVYNRPYCTDFVKFCLERFEVGIWSSAREANLGNALDFIMVGLRNKVLFAWGQNRCTDTGFKTLENQFKPIFLKELDKIWDNKYSDLPSRVGRYSSKNTLLIDTDPYKALLNPPDTAVFPAAYEADNENDDALGPKGQLRLYLDGVVDADDVPSYVKNHKFGQPAITSKHPHWQFYSKIIRRHQKK